MGAPSALFALGLACASLACARPVTADPPAAPPLAAQVAPQAAARVPAQAAPQVPAREPSPVRVRADDVVFREAAGAHRIWTGWRFDHLGFAVAIGGRFDGDALPDLALGGFTPGADHARVLVQPGHGKGRALPPLLELHDVPGAEWGASLAFVGDVDGGGRDDLVVGVPSYSEDPDAPQQGAVLVFLGERHAGGEPLDALDADMRIVGDARHARLGWCVAGVGDVDGDGHPDVAVGAPGCDDDPSAPDAPDCARQTGGVLILPGGPAFLGTYLGEPAPEFRKSVVVGTTLHGDAPGDHFGWSVAGLGDLDGDGRAEFVVGAPQARRSSAFAFERTTGTGYVGIASYRESSGIPKLRVRVRPPEADPPRVTDLWMFGTALAALPASGDAGRPVLAVGAPQLERATSGAVGGVFAYDARALLAEEGDEASLLGDTRGLPREALFDDGMLGWSLAMARGPEGVLLMAGAPRAERVDGRVLIL
ncbi:MAG: integrin alpha, partial [Planctomycetota bacterium]